MLALERSYKAWQEALASMELANLFINAVNKFARFQGFRGNLQQRVEWGKKALEVAEQIGQVSAIAELCASTIAWPLLQQGDYEAAKKYCELGLKAALQCEAPLWAGHAARGLSGIARDRQQAAEAKHWADQAFDFAQKSGDQYLERGAKMDLGYAALLNGDPATTEKLFRELLQYYKEINDEELIANYYMGVAIAVLNQGRVEEARKLYIDSIQDE